MVQTNTSGPYNYTLTETGDKPYTLTGTQDANTGDNASTETGTDNYSMSETGFDGTYNFSQDVSGSDQYTAINSANSQSGAFSQSYGGTDDSTLSVTGTNPDDSSDTSAIDMSGTNSYSDTQTGDTRDAEVTLTQAGRDRYTLLNVGFNNPSNGSQGTAGVVDFSPVGLPALVTRMSVPAGIFSSIGDNRYDYCFAAGTLVLMADGSRKAIEKIEVGEMVLAAPDTDPEAEPKPSKVIRLFHNAPSRLFKVTAGGRSIRCTANHPFYVKGKGWVSVAKLQPRDQLRSLDSQWSILESVCDTGEIEPVFNLEVEATHTYFVQSIDGGVGVLVHNTSVVDAPPVPAPVAAPPAPSGPVTGVTVTGAPLGGTPGTTTVTGPPGTATPSPGPGASGVTTGPGGAAAVGGATTALATIAAAGALGNVAR